MANSNLVSIIIPLFNEEDSLAILIKKLIKSTKSIDSKFEFIFVNDGSTDKSLNIIKKLYQKNFKIISLVRNLGQTAAIMAGIDNCKGEIIVMMDADGQNDPSDIPKLLDMIKNGGFDVVSGWRYKRNDGFLGVFQ